MPERTNRTVLVERQLGTQNMDRQYRYQLPAPVPPYITQHRSESTRLVGQRSNQIPLGLAGQKDLLIIYGKKDLNR